jgi:hypothetical protein
MADEVEYELEITQEALSGYGRLLRAVGRRILVHVTPDGGMICEDRASIAHPTLWRISHDGAVRADTPYSYANRAFVAAQLPARV